jgi:hypothetical protein
MYKATLAAAAVLASCVSASSAAAPCDGVDRRLTADQKAVLAPPLAEQLHAPNVAVLQAFRFSGWSVVYVQPPASDGPFLFFNRDPAAGRYVALWSGAAAPSEEQDIKNWALKNAPGIPARLAGCFAFHVTQDRDM